MKTTSPIYILVITISSLCFLSCTNNVQVENKNELIEFLKTENDSLRRITSQLPTSDTITNQNDFNNNYWYNVEQDGRSLKAAGITDPENHIKQALHKNPQLIPQKAVLGGKMHFNKIQLLGSEWLISDYEDGHIQGKALFRYSINNDEVEFELLDSINHE